MTGMNLKREIDQIAKDKGIDIDEIIGALEEAMKQAARRRHPGEEKEIEARFNPELGEIERAVSVFVDFCLDRAKKRVDQGIAFYQSCI